jgi:hypothetical protein
MTPPSDESPSFFARTNFRDKGIPVGIKQADRLSHVYVTGKTGTGKSTLLETLALQAVVRGRGMILIDPHRDLAERVVKAVPAHRRQDVISMPGHEGGATISRPLKGCRKILVESVLGRCITFVQCG